jgi:hypothetical protein
MAVAPSALGESLRERDELRLISCVRVSNAIAHFAQCLPFRVRCSNDLDRGLAWAPRKLAFAPPRARTRPAGLEDGAALRCRLPVRSTAAGPIRPLSARGKLLA